MLPADVGPTGVLVGEPAGTLIVPLLGGGTTPPVPVEMAVDRVVDGQYVVVKVLVIVVPLLVTVVVPVEVVVLLVETPVEEEVEAV